MHIVTVINATKLYTKTSLKWQILLYIVYHKLEILILYVSQTIELYTLNVWIVWYVS